MYLTVAALAGPNVNAKAFRRCVEFLLVMSSRGKVVLDLETCRILRLLDLNNAIPPDRAIVVAQPADVTGCRTVGHCDDAILLGQSEDWPYMLVFGSAFFVGPIVRHADEAYIGEPVVSLYGSPRAPVLNREQWELGAETQFYEVPSMPTYRARHYLRI